MPKIKSKIELKQKARWIFLVYRPKSSHTGHSGSNKKNELSRRFLFCINIEHEIGDNKVTFMNIQL